MEEEKKLMTDREVLSAVKDLMIMKTFTYNTCVRSNLNQAMWGLIIDQLAKPKKKIGNSRNDRVYRNHRGK
jgi:hypothetical protein